MSQQRNCLVYLAILVSSICATPIEVQNVDNPQVPVGKVIFVNVVYRHGDRTPIDPYPNDPYGDLKYWSTGWGQLTTTGMRQHYELGKWLRDRYRSLLKDDYYRDDIFIQSTDVDRTLMSAMSHLAGMYPPSHHHEFNASLRWQPIPIHTIPEQMDNIVAMKKHCPKYEEELERVKTSGEILKLQKQYSELFAYLTRNTGRDVHEIKTAEFIHNALFIEDVNNLTLPDWTKSVYPEPLRTVSEISFTIPTYTPGLARLKAGPLVGKLLENFLTKIDGKMDPDRKMYMYSAHDTTVANLLNTLRVFEPSCPPYAALILLELQQKGNDYFVAVYYRNSTAEPSLLTIPGCQELCPLKTFEALMRPVIPEDWEEECHGPAVTARADLNAFRTGALVLCFVAVLGLLVMACVQRRSYRDSYFRIQ